MSEQSPEEKIATLEQVVNNVYRERAHLVSLLSAIFGGTISYSDPDTPDWPVVMLHTPAGQLSWHIGPGDVDLFDHMTPLLHGPEWDGHSTDEKYARIRALTTEIAEARDDALALLAARPEPEPDPVKAGEDTGTPEPTPEPTTPEPEPDPEPGRPARRASSRRGKPSA